MKWEGEFVGKYLTHMVQLLRVTGDARLKRTIDEVVALLAAYQAPDGYLGQSATPWTPIIWDTWNHYHIMLGLLLYVEATADAAARAVLMKIAGCLQARFGGAGGPRALVALGSQGMNGAVSRGSHSDAT
jgi:DUF1680 family protein